MPRVTVTGTLNGEPVEVAWEDGQRMGNGAVLKAAEDYAQTHPVAALGQPLADTPAGLDEPYAFAITVAAVMDPGSYRFDGLEPHYPENDPEFDDPQTTP